MNKFLALATLSILMITIVPGLASYNQHYVLVVSAKDVTVVFILNESKTVTIMWYTQYPQYCYSTFDYSGYNIIPANTTVYICSQYPFEIVLSNKTYYSVYVPYFRQYIINVTFMNSTTVYINFLPSPPPPPKTPVLIAPPLPAGSSTPKTTPQVTTSESFTNTQQLEYNLVLVLIAVIVLIISLLAINKRK